MKNMTFWDLEINIWWLRLFKFMYEFWMFEGCGEMIKRDWLTKLCLKVGKKSTIWKKLEKKLPPKFLCLKSWKTWVFGTWKSISDDFDDLWTCMNFESLSDVERWWSEINEWNYVWRSEINQCFRKIKKKNWPRNFHA